MPQIYQGTADIAKEKNTASDFASMLLETIPGNFIIRQPDNDNRFYFLCENNQQTIPAFSRNGFHIIQMTVFSDQLLIGFGLGDVLLSGNTVFRAKSKATYQLWFDILEFTFFRNFSLPDYFNYESHFKGTLDIDGIRCYYIHDYSPIHHSESEMKKAKEIQQVRNCVFAFKDGEKPELWAKIFSLCIKGTPELTCILDNAVIVPIPASTRERNIIRYATFCRILAEKLGINDGFRTTWIQYDREEMKGQTDKNILANLSFNKKYIRGKHVVLCDDIFTTGGSLRQMSGEMMKLGALSVVGVFLGKTE